MPREEAFFFFNKREGNTHARMGVDRVGRLPGGGLTLPTALRHLVFLLLALVFLPYADGGGARLSSPHPIPHAHTFSPSGAFPLPPTQKKNENASPSSKKRKEKKEAPFNTLSSLSVTVSLPHTHPFPPFSPFPFPFSSPLRHCSPLGAPRERRGERGVHGGDGDGVQLFPHPQNLV